ncbi:molybdenum cofactor biosynthesis protein MoaE [Goodfellowiella coeruleoviolacea]|uniref:Molybdopterin synthase catalytic subunit n=1 Tax=Goodfellowiella coeruleoviolacea TaxID=334858 RepID=A0AAE3GKS2_9PSEU|nr:molybdenum cofactor biosynthesis protein MoaE [Goodfellowiella coeruleoviolacea]MCP2169305.1 molybdopterin synthase catalytic subunit [Goodfellowiella coeruleoviolacea]
MTGGAASGADRAGTRTARVITASNRAAAGVYADRGGPVIVEWLRARGYQVADPVVVPDGDPVTAALRAAVADQVGVVVTTGGTGINPTDRTPEATRAVLDYEIPGLADAVRRAGLPGVPTAVLSRGLAGVAGRTLVVNLPGSVGGVRDGLGVLAGVLDHAVDQLHGGDHRPGGHAHDHRPAAGPGTAVQQHDHGPETAVQGAAVQGAAVQEAAGPETAGPETAGPETAEPPVRPEVLRADVGTEPLSAAEHAQLVSDRAAGAVVTFEGVVRDHDGGRTVRELEYVGHPSAGDIVAEVAAEVAAKHDGVRALAVSHRLGVLAIGDVALACAVSAAHRREAFAACADLVDEVKRRLPVWKRQVFADGAEEWVNCP